MKKLLLLLLVISFSASILIYAQDSEFTPGVKRWNIKTSLVNFKTVPLADLLQLNKPFEHFIEAEFDKNRIPIIVQPDSLKEGDIVTTTGWLHLVAQEDDGDYHIQITNSREWEDSCLIVEVPYAGFVKDTGLSEKCADVRKFIREEILNEDGETIGEDSLETGVYVTITGQLFYDGGHGGMRGKSGMRSYTLWELHPLFSIKLEQEPDN